MSVVTGRAVTTFQSFSVLLSSLIKIHLLRPWLSHFLVIPSCPRRIIFFQKFSSSLSFFKSIAFPANRPICILYYSPVNKFNKKKYSTGFQTSHKSRSCFPSKTLAGVPAAEEIEPSSRHIHSHHLFRHETKSHLAFLLCLISLAYGDVSAQQSPGSLQNNGYAYLENFNSSMAMVIVFLVCAFFLVGFFHLHSPLCRDAHRQRRRVPRAQQQRRLEFPPVVKALTRP
ncbi:hypothetical protein M0R45_004971 [Rubus argutus]|uniref:Uncharacterized protein n=1 Tax=Rubus argutus TaxID=59490 RepID=A0AAW1YL99_RUBAR